MCCVYPSFSTPVSFEMHSELPASITDREALYQLKIMCHKVIRMSPAHPVPYAHDLKAFGGHAQELHASIKGRAVQQEGLLGRLSELLAAHLHRHSAANEATQATTTQLLTRLTEAASCVTAAAQGLVTDGHRCLQVCIHSGNVKYHSKRFFIDIRNHIPSSFLGFGKTDEYFWRTAC